MNDTQLQLLTPGDDVDAVGEVFRSVWGTPHPLIPRSFLVAIVHSGGYVVVATDRSGRPVATSVGILGTDDRGQSTLHSHITGVVPERRGSGLGFTIKQHQRRWASERDLTAITWTFDPLVRANAWFNIARLGAEVVAYRRNFYGEMTDDINRGDESDRLIVRWNVNSTSRESQTSRHSTTTLVSTPEDIVALRRSDPGAVARWRHRHRTDLETPLNSGASVIDFTPAGEYVLHSGS
ncbi:MAG: GNAT family N-acetyltransferase [Actinomycetota bacterium]